MPVFLTTGQAEMSRIWVQCKSWRNSCEDPILKKPAMKIKGLVVWLKCKKISLANMRP
jgi:hypothetical protein